MRFGLEEHIIDQITKIFEANAKVDKAFIFGSRAKGNYRPDSDIDIAIKGFDIVLDDILKLSIALDEIGLTHKIDLINYNRIKEIALVEHIDRVGVEVYRRWKEYKLSELCNLIGGGTPKTSNSEYWDGDIPWLSVTDFNYEKKYCFNAEKKITKKGVKESSTKILKKGQIIISARGTVGVIAVLGIDMAFNQSCYGIDANTDITYNDFLYYLLKYCVPQFLSNSYGAIFNTITRETFEQIIIRIPPLPEQTIIATVLSSLDNKIELLQRQNKTLEELAETLFKQWFIEKREDTWILRTISEFIEVRDGTHDSPKQSVEGRFLITSKHIKPSGIDFSNAYKISESNYIEINKRSKVDENDILFSMIGTLGLIHRVEQNPDYAIKNIGLFKSSKKPWLASFLFLLLKSPIGKSFVYESADGSTQEYITLNSLRNFEFFYPGEIKIKEFDKIVNPFFFKIKSNNYQIQNITKLRNTILPKLMNGEVRVKPD
jgi:type I restriction enzyme S subunit